MTQPEDDGTGYLGVLTVINPANMSSQVFVITEVNVAQLPMIVKDLGQNISTVRNSVLQQARKLDLKKIASEARADNRRPKRPQSGVSWPACIILMLFSAISASAVTWSARPTTTRPTTTSVKEEKGPKKATYPKPKTQPKKGK